MIRVVALDVTTWWGGVALVAAEQDGVARTVAEAGIRVGDSHAAHLLRLLETLMAEAGWGRDVVDLYAATRGPGSFTGIRIGLGTVRGLALAAGRGALGIGTLEALAEAHGPAQGERVPVLDAGRGEVYAARYDAEGSPPEEREAPWLGPPGRLLASGPEAVLFGPGLAAHATALRAAGFHGPLAAAPTSVAAAAGRLALLRRDLAGRAEDGLAPVYLRPPDAEAPTRRAP
jgi:tRNA threonylcarbamoyladenosine biosynthesis protein TsaB